MCVPSQNTAYTRWPSAAGVEDAIEFFWWIVWFGGPPGTSFDHSTLPVDASTQTRARLRLSSVEVWTKTFPFETMGEELPRPGIGVFQRISLGPIVSGSLVSGAVPRPSGPRNRSQSAATRPGAARATARRAIRGAWMTGGLWEGPLRVGRGKLSPNSTRMSAELWPDGRVGTVGSVRPTPVPTVR